MCFLEKTETIFSKIIILFMEMANATPRASVLFGMVTM